MVMSYCNIDMFTSMVYCICTVSLPLQYCVILEDKEVCKMDELQCYMTFQNLKNRNLRGCFNVMLHFSKSLNLGRIISFNFLDRNFLEWIIDSSMEHEENQSIGS